MKENNNDDKLTENDSNAIEKNDTGEKTLSDWQMYKLAISNVAFTSTIQEDLYSVITTAQEDFQCFASLYSLGQIHSA